MTPLENITARIWLCVVLIVTLAVSAFSPILKSPFKVIYDRPAIVENPLVRDFQPVAVVTPSMFKPQDPYRPLALASHALEYRFFSLTPFFFYLTNIILHVLNALLVFVLMLSIVRDRPTAFVVAALFAVHPAQWPVVGLLSGRPELLNSFFNLSAMLLCGLYLRRLNGWWLAGSLVCFTAALLSLEAREFFCAVVIVYILSVSCPEQHKGLRRLIVLPYVVLTLSYIGVRHALSPLSWPVGALADAGTWSKGLTACVLQMFNLLLPGVDLVLPEAVPVIWLPGVIMIAGMVLLAIKHLPSQRRVTGWFLAAWLILNAWPVLTATFFARETKAHITYLALVPLIALVALAMAKAVSLVIRHAPSARRILTLAAVVIIALFFWLTFQKANESFDEINVIQSALRRRPATAQEHYALGVLYEARHQTAQAQEEFRQVLILDPEMVKAQIALAQSYQNAGQLLEAVKVYESIRTSGADQAMVEAHLQAAYNVLVLNQQAVLAKKPGDINAYFSLGLFYAKLGDKGNAINAYQNVIDLDAQNTSGLRNMALKFQGMIFQELGNDAKAQENFERAR